MEERLKSIFVEALGIEEDLVIDELEYNSTPEWDSIAHMVLIAAIDEDFDIMLDTDDVIDMSSFAKAKEILAKYDLDI